MKLKFFLTCILIVLSVFVYAQKKQPTLKVNKSPVFKKDFTVGVIFIQFYEAPIKPFEEYKSLFSFNGINVDSYFKEYTNGASMPITKVLPDENLTKTAFIAPHPIGYFAIHGDTVNPFGYKNLEEGKKRVDELHEQAIKYALTNQPRVGKTKPLSDKDIDIFCFVYETRLTSPDKFKSFMKPIFERGYELGRAVQYRNFLIRLSKLPIRERASKEFDKDEPWANYAPSIQFNEALYPNANTNKIQLLATSSGKDMIQQLAHCLGTPELERFEPKDDGIGGEPALRWSLGPAGMAYSRYLHTAILKENAYPTISESQDYTLYPRNSTPSPTDNKPVGYFIKTNHPNYLLFVEYVYKEKPYESKNISEGMLISCLNITKENNFLGSPDMYYVYRPTDSAFNGGGELNNAIFSSASKRNQFTEKTNPASFLPTLTPTGVEITNIQEKKGTLTFNLKTSYTPMKAKEVKQSLLPKAILHEVKEIQPTSAAFKGEIVARGSPLFTEYGVCYHTSKNPTIKNLTFALYHKDRFSGRLLNLKPNTTYYMKAYAKNELGVAYSEDALSFKTLAENASQAAVAPLLGDNYSDNELISTKYTFKNLKNKDDKNHYFSIAVLAKLVNYYRGPQLTKKKINYAQMHINPSISTPESRLEVTREVLSNLKEIAGTLGMDKRTLSNDFMKDFTKTFKIKKTIERHSLKRLGKDKLGPLIIKELEKSRPVLFCQITRDDKLPPSLWRIIDGHKEGKFRIDFITPSFLEEEPKESGYYTLDILLKDCTDVYFFTGISFGIK